MISLRFCSHKAKMCAESAAAKSHFGYLFACMLLDGHLILRIASGGCLVLCLLGTVLKDKEEEHA